MARVTVSAQRISSMLANRNKSVSDVAADVPLSVDLSVLVATDTELLFEDLVAWGSTLTPVVVPAHR